METAAARAALNSGENCTKGKPNCKEITGRLLKMLQDWRRAMDAKMPQPKGATSSIKQWESPTTPLLTRVGRTK